MIWIVLIGVIVLTIYLMCRTSKKESEIHATHPGYAPPAFTPPGSVSPAVAKPVSTYTTTAKPVIKQPSANHVPIYTYTGNRPVARCPACDGENDVHAFTCRICGSEIRM